MDWASLALELGTEYLKYRNKKLSVKYKEKLADIKDELWEEENKPYEEKDMAIIVNLLREKSQLEILFYDEIRGALSEKNS